MSGWNWSCWSSALAGDSAPREPERFSLPSPIPEWPKGGQFAKGSICIGELEVLEISRFQSVWSCLSSKRKVKGGAIFYKPLDIPNGYFSLGHYAHQYDKPLQGFLLVVRENPNYKTETSLPALSKPLDYELVWGSGDFFTGDLDDCGHIWLPLPPEGYKAMGYLVKEGPGKPSIEEIRCVRSDLTDSCEAKNLIIDMQTIFPDLPCKVWKVRPSSRGMRGKGISVGTFFCSTCPNFEKNVDVSCLKNFDSSLQAMPNLDQIHALIKHYGPALMFHPKEIYLPSSVSWFFENGAVLYQRNVEVGEQINAEGSNLPLGGHNDGEYWIDLPSDDRNAYVKQGYIDSAKLYIHVKPAQGGTFTDIVMWIFCPFNGPATLKIGLVNFPLGKIGQHVGDWEHFTLRISNFTGELWSIYFSQHSGGQWIDACSLEFLEGNRAIVYSSKNGHASFPHAGNYIQGNKKLGIGIRNDAVHSKLIVDSSKCYQIVAAEYLRDTINEPFWLQYMREWGPTVVYNSKSELDRILSFLPFNLRYTVANIFKGLPTELYGEEGPSGPKEKNNWEGDERC